MFRLRLHISFCFAAAGLLAQANAVPGERPSVAVAEVNNPAASEQLTARQTPPLVYFRQLLASKPEERDALLAGRSADQKRMLLAKVSEYQALPPEIRELRLRHTELRWHLLDLMKMKPEQRSERLRGVPMDDRPLILERLAQWDALPEDVKRQFLEHQGIIATYLERHSTIMPPDPAALSSERKKLLDEELKRLESLPENERQRMCELFRQFFDQGDKEKQKTIGYLTVAQRKQLTAALQEFKDLTPEQRKQRIEALAKFVNMTPAEREGFMANAARWRAMSPAEREVWRKMVFKLPPMPPMPPSLAGKLPPLPPGMRPIPALPVPPPSPTDVSPQATRER